MDASKTALGHANVEISTNATANIKYLYYYVSKGEDRNVTSIRRKEADQAVDEVGRPAAHGDLPLQIYLCPTPTPTVRAAGRGVPQLSRRRPGQQRVLALPSMAAAVL